MKLLIPISYLKEECFLSDNVDERKYASALKEAQFALREILGAEFYEQIETQYDPNTNTFTADNLELYEDYIKDYLAWQTYMEYLGFAQSDSTATGLREHSDENSTIVDNIKLYSLEKNVAQRVRRRKNGVINFLCISQTNTSTRYPLWTKCSMDEFAWGISSVSGRKLGVFSVHKAIERNE